MMFSVMGECTGLGFCSALMHLPPIAAHHAKWQALFRGQRCPPSGGQGCSRPRRGKRKGYPPIPLQGRLSHRCSGFLFNKDGGVGFFE